MAGIACSDTHICRLITLICAILSNYGLHLLSLTSTSLYYLESKNDVL